MTSYPVPMTIHRNESYMCLMNFKLKGTVIEKKKLWSEIILKRKKKTGRKPFGVASTQPQTSRLLQGKKNRLFAVIVLTHCTYFLTRSLLSSLFLVGFKTEVVISSSFVLTSFVNESKITVESSFC